MSQRGRSSQRVSLPVERTTFVGRKREVAQIVSMFGEVKLLTLVGVGGTGKTRLALRVAQSGKDVFPDGVHFVDLASLADGALVTHATAMATNIPAVALVQHPGRSSEEQLARHLEGREMLVVLDNCEHVRDGCARLLEVMLRDCPSVAWLATSREPLAVEGESVFRVHPLALPATAEREAILDSEAVRLFVERAARWGAVAVTPENARAIGAICARLDGIPLAIELAAARTRHLAIPQIQAKLDEDLRLLTSGEAGAHRHSTLDAALDWSFDLLAPTEQALLRRVAVFVGGFTLDAAEGVCADDVVATESIIDVLSSLIDKSFVEVDQSDSCARYRLLEPVRQYADTKLSGPERTLVQGRHAAWFVGLAERIVPSVSEYGHVQVHRLQSGAAEAPLEGDADNCRAALEQCLTNGRIDRAMQLAARLWRVWLRLGGHEEARRRLQSVLHAGAEEVGCAEEHLAVLLALAAVDIHLGDFAAGYDHASRARALAAAIGVEAALPIALHHQGLASAVTGAGDPGLLFAEGLGIARRQGQPIIAADLLKELGEFHLVQGRYDEAASLLDQSLELLTGRSRDDVMRTHYLTSRCLAAILSGDGEGAVRFGSEALERTRRSSRDPRSDVSWGGGVSYAALSCGLAMATVGRFEEGRDLIVEAMKEIQRLRYPLDDADCLVAFAGAAILEGRLERGALLLGAARATMARNGAWRRHTGGALYLYFVGKIRERLPRDVADRARDAGRTMLRDEAIAYALDGPEDAVRRGDERSSPAEPSRRASTIRRDGEYWTISYENRVNRFRDSRGPQYLAQLLWHPNREFHATELTNPGGPSSETCGDSEALVMVNDLGDAGAVLDATAQAAYRRRVAELREDLEEATRLRDLSMTSRLRGELDLLMEQLAGSARGRRAASRGERARIAVTKSIKSALDKITEADPALGRHLRAQVRRGYFCVYISDAQSGAWER